MSFNDPKPSLRPVPESSLFPSCDLPPRKVTHSRKKPDDHIPRPPNAFILFRSSFVKSDHVSTAVESNHSTLSKIIGYTWGMLPPAEKQIWFDKAKAMLDEHKAKYPGYSFRPESKSPTPYPTKKRKVREVGPKDAKRCEKIAELLVKGKKGAELDQAVDEFDRSHVPEVVTRFDAPVTARHFRRSSSAPADERPNDPFFVSVPPTNKLRSVSSQPEHSYPAYASLMPSPPGQYMLALATEYDSMSSEYTVPSSPFADPYEYAAPAPNPEMVSVDPLQCVEVALTVLPGFRFILFQHLRCPFPHRILRPAFEPVRGSARYLRSAATSCVRDAAALFPPFRWPAHRHHGRRRLGFGPIFDADVQFSEHPQSLPFRVHDIPLPADILPLRDAPAARRAPRPTSRHVPKQLRSAAVVATGRGVLLPADVRRACPDRHGGARCRLPEVCGHLGSSVPPGALVRPRCAFLSYPQSMKTLTRAAHTYLYSRYSTLVSLSSRLCRLQPLVGQHVGLYCIVNSAQSHTVLYHYGDAWKASGCQGLGYYHSHRTQCTERTPRLFPRYALVCTIDVPWSG